VAAVIEERNGISWRSLTVAEFERDVNGETTHRRWRAIHPQSGQEYYKGSDVAGSFHPIDYFLLMFPPTQLTEMLSLTNAELEQRQQAPTTIGEILKLFGVLILVTRFEFGDRRSLWSKEGPTPFIPAANFGRTGMSRNRFELLWVSLQWSRQPPLEEQDAVGSETFRWALVQDFVDRFNEYRKAAFVPGETICVDESMSRWYGQGGSWINHGLPMYIAIDRKPENGCEIQNSACGESGVMLRLKLVMGDDGSGEGHVGEGGEGHVGEGAESDDADDMDGVSLSHGGRICVELIEPWLHSDRIVCADSYFASVATAVALKRRGVRFIGVVKTAHRGFPKKTLGSVELFNRGDSRSLLTKIDGVEVMALVWMDRDRRMFISTCKSAQLGRPYVRRRWRQVDPTPNASPVLVDLTVAQPRVCEAYYTTCAAIDQHNRCRQDDLQLVRKIQTVEWHRRVGVSLLGICVVDAWLVFKAAQGRGKDRGAQRSFYEHLSMELIDNTFDTRAGRTKRSSPSAVARHQSRPTMGIDATHVAPTKRRRKKQDGTVTPYLLQGRCTHCQRATTNVCSSCSETFEEVGEYGGWICSSRQGRNCFTMHLAAHHIE
jgi:hypothetical protein